MGVEIPVPAEQLDDFAAGGGSPNSACSDRHFVTVSAQTVT